MITFIQSIIIKVKAELHLIANFFNFFCGDDPSLFDYYDHYKDDVDDSVYPDSDSVE